MTATHSCIPLTSPCEWKEALQGVRHSFGHTWENCFAMYLTTGHATYLYCLETEEARILCPISVREWGEYKDILKPFGFSGFVGTAPCPQFPELWKEFVGRRGYVCGYLGIHPVFGFAGNLNGDEVYQYDTVHILDLTLGLGQLLSRMSANRRRQLRDWDAIRGELVVDKLALSEYFLTHYVDFFKRKGAEDFYLLSKETLSVIFSLDNTFMVGTGRSGRIETVAVFTYTEYMADYLFSIASPEGRNLASTLIWYAVTYLKSLGVPLLNLGGGAGGVGESKRRYGATSLPLRCIKQVYAPDTYSMLCSKAGCGLQDRTGYFPSYQRVV